MNKINTFVLISFCFLAISCTKESNAPAKDLQSDFYPLKINSVLVYDVDSTAYSNFTNTSTNYKFEIKDSITNTFDDLAGGLNYRIERYKRLNVNSPWVFQQVFTRSKTVRSGEEFINNQRFIRIIFPPLAGSFWNGNSKNTIGEQDYSIENDIAASTINTLTFDSTIVVKEIDEQNLIREDLVYATYAKKVGLVQKEVTAVDKNISSGKITNGFKFTLKIKSIK
ncbi:hypothetical protein A5893_15140 [Pedobacter psychrophilus]|uniref:Uncharacterized protein n=1 Tax=Pedobacter psychrophilus TaxID=1826909 RepID=A0A179DAQ9_9SPHI|nr:hypothetical protein [Pedobacter psychrophilus]OAQ38136.1 hypothetical protein A5893_15140 [Pedobacter psychrophilus]